MYAVKETDPSGAEPPLLINLDKLQCQQNFVCALPFCTDGLLIREIRHNDVDAFHEIVSHEGFVYYCFDGSKESTAAFVQEAIKSQEEGNISLRTSYMLAVEEVASRSLVGHVTADILDKDPNHFDLAYFTHPGHQRKGIAKKAARILLHNMFTHFDLTHLVATTHPDNHASLKVLSWLGFKETGEVTEVESANGENERILLKLERSNFVKKHGLLWSPQA